MTDIAYGCARVDGHRTLVVKRGDLVTTGASLSARADSVVQQLLSADSLRPLLAAGRAGWRRVFEWIARAPDGEFARRPLAAAELGLELPFEVADYVDFYSSESHATNVGRIFRPAADPLPANWLHLPIGYHGRAGTVVPSGTPIVRPVGQRLTPGGTVPDVGPSSRLDVEVEVGFVVGTGTSLGTRVLASAWRDHVFGIVLVNDWSARDIQAWEYVPLGPFLGKSFATSISCWVTPLDALEGSWVPPPPRQVDLLPYLSDPPHPAGIDIELALSVNGVIVARPPFRDMYWSAAQQLAHLTVNGASLRTGDLYASGTVSGWKQGEFGSLLELTWNGERPLALDDGRQLTFLEDGDEVRISGVACGRNGNRVTLGEVRGRIGSAL